MKTAEYTVKEMSDFLDMMSGMYDLARVVDPVECRVLELGGDGQVGMCENCYDVWHAGQRCMNCSSFNACRTGCHTEKSEYFQDKIYSIHSNPVKLRLPDGGMYDAVVELISMRDDNGEEVGPEANDREAENIDFKAIQFQAHHDTLTKVLNVEAFYELCRNRIMKKPETSWVMITGDIMDFRLVNNLFGVAKGNEVLVKTAELLLQVARSGGGLCGRLAGDHFAVLLPGIMYNEDVLNDVAQTISDLIQSGIYKLCIHFGVYEIQDSSLPVSVMCDRANIALLTIRHDVRATVAYFDAELMKERLFEQEVISKFESVLEDGQFQIYLQPLTTEDGTPFGAEALVRWVRPDGTVLMPGRFIEILENSGLIPELDTHVWEMAIRQLSLWKGTNKEHLTISVNMSARDFYYIDIYEVLMELLARYDVDCGKLRLEITETTLIDDPVKIDMVLRKLRDAGFYVEIDDFGKGSSSLSLLKDVHADMLKIDMGFLQVTGDRSRNCIIVKSIIDLAGALGMDVVTEGVETKMQLDSLTELGCRHFQGFYFSHPLPVAEFEEKYF